MKSKIAYHFFQNSFKRKQLTLSVEAQRVTLNSMARKVGQIEVIVLLSEDEHLLSKYERLLSEDEHLLSEDERLLSGDKHL